MKKILITGGCGFIGVNLIEALMTSNAQVRVLDNMTVGTREALSEVCKFEEISFTSSGEHPREGVVQLLVGDITDADAVSAACEGMDSVVHLAANTGVGPSVESPMLDCTQNVIGTVTVLEGMRQHGVRKFIFASSGAPAGEVEPPIHEEVVPHPVSPYGASKLAGEAYCSAYFRTFGIATIALRFGNVYGPKSGHKSSIVAKFITRALSGKKLEIYGDGSQTRDFVYIADLVSAITAALDASDIGGEIFQIATNSETTVNEVTEKICDTLIGKGYSKPEVVFSEPRLGDVARNYSDTTKAKTVLGWQPRHTLEQGLEMTVMELVKNP